MDDDDREARFVRLYRDLQPKIAAYVRRRLPEPDAADALAETFLTAWRGLDGVPDDPLPWLYHIPANSVAADPPLDPPGVRSGSHGLRVTPQVTDSVKGHSPGAPADAPGRERPLIDPLSGLPGYADLSREIRVRR